MVWMARNGNVVQGEKPRFRVKHWWREVWSRERNCGFGSNAGGGKYGPGRETAGLGQALPRPSVVRGEKLWSWVKRWWREVWSREPNCGPGQALPRPSVVRGEKLWSWVKHWWREVWSREPNCGPGQARPRPSVVRGEKIWSLVKRWWREVWSREPNRAPGSSPSPPECGPRREIMVLGQALVAESMVQGEKLQVWVKLSPTVAWSREPNRAPGSPPAPPKCGPGSKTVPPGQARPCPGMVQGAKPCPRVKPDPTVAWSREPNRAPGSPPAPPKCGLGSQTVPPGHPRPRRSMV